MHYRERQVVRQTVLECRRLLEEGFDEALRRHGLLEDRVIEISRLRDELQPTRAGLEEALRRESAEHSKARNRYKKHAAFTLLNRLIALRAFEVNGLVEETVRTRPEYGDRSRRERDLVDNDPVLAGRPEELARIAFEQACRDMADRHGFRLLFTLDGDPYSLLLPPVAVYWQVREQLAGVPEQLWRNPEVLGWAYQYFNDEERARIRVQLRGNPEPDQIPALNQFYTVHWIVRFLVDNTLGRLWLEARPDSRLREKLGYLVPGNQTPGALTRDLRPEDICILDPACGSGHFLVYAFDLLLEIWREAHPEIPPWRIPACILEHNLFGVDVDLRACQIAATALYLKARSTFEQLRGDERNASFDLRRLNVVCADVRFTDGKRREAFLQEFGDDRQLQRVVAQVLDDCENAFEIGSLLRLREPFEKLIAQCTREQAGNGLALFVLKCRTVDQIVGRIRDFVQHAAARHDMGTVLFGLDAHRAVNLAEVLSERYHVVLMNPPYGAMPVRCKAYARTYFPRTHADYYTAFIEQAINLTSPGGFVGALTGRTFLFLKSFQKLREEILRDDALPELVLDLGFNVLDGATARYAAFTLRRRSAHEDSAGWRNHCVTFFRLTPFAWEEKREQFERALETLGQRMSEVAGRCE